MKGIHLTLVKRQLYENEFHEKHLKAPRKVLLEVWQGPHFLYILLLAKVKPPPLQFTKIGDLHSTWTLDIMTCQKWGETPYQNIKCW